MVQPNCKVYPVAYITEKIYRKYERNIMELAKKTNAEIGFDFRQQFFNIRAQTQESVDTCVRHISGGLFPILNRALDDNMMEGTYRKLTDPEPPEPIDEQPAHGTPASRSTSVAGSVTTIVGRPPLLDGEDTSKEKSVLVGRPDYDDDGDSYDEPEEYTGVFTIAKNIKDPMEVLIGPPLPNLQPAQYLTLIGDATDTECTLEGRDVIVKGYAQNCVDDAVQRFQNIQTIYKNRKKKTIVTPCIHYPTHSPQYGLYFCDLNRYAFKDYVDLFDHIPRPLYVLLPVFRDPGTNSFKKPKDLLDAPPIPPPMPAMPPPTPQWPGRPPHLAQMSPSPNPQPQQWNTRQVSPVATTPSPLNVGFPGEAPLWGENRNFTNNRASAASYPPPSPSPSSTSTSYTSNRSSAPSPMLDDFPALPSSRAYTVAPTLGPPPRPQTRRVLRINPQKSGQGSPQPTTSMLELAKEYNLNNIKSALEEGLNRARFFKGEIRLEAKLGKVLWTKMTSEVQTRIWELLDIKDIVMKEHGIEPLFNDITTMSEALIGSISDFLPRHYSRTAYFEIHCHARTSPSIPAKPVTLVMGQGVVELQKVILHQEKITEIDWVCLDRKFDFQFSLSARELGRTDVKPYTTFIKKISISPMTLQMTYENVPGFLEVDYIYHKQTTKYRIHFPFIVEITRVEKIPLKPQKTASYGAEKILGMTGKGQVWYEMHVYYDLHKELFKSNLNLDVGKTAHWKVDQVLGTPDQYGQPEALVSYVRCLLLLVEKCQSLRI